jgi:hypothetical protein
MIQEDGLGGTEDGRELFLRGYQTSRYYMRVG